MTGSKSTLQDEKLSACIHVDLDGASAIYAAHNWKTMKEQDTLFETGFTNLLNFFKLTGVQATFFAIAGDVADGRKRELMEEAIVQGHEIASHSLTHRLLTSLSRDEKRREVFESREKLEAVLGVPVRGFRAPGFDIDREVLEMIDDAGYAYDSSLFPSEKFANRAMVSRIHVTPQVLFSGRPLVEIPLPKHTPLPLPFHICYSLVLGSWYFRLGVNAFRRTGAPLILLFHLTDMADPSEYMQVRGWKEKFFTLSFLSLQEKTKRCGSMFEFVGQSYRFVKTEQLLHTVSLG